MVNTSQQRYSFRGQWQVVQYFALVQEIGAIISCFVLSIYGQGIAESGNARCQRGYDRCELGHADLLGSNSTLSRAILRKFASLDRLGKLTALEMLLGSAARQPSPVQELRLLSSCLQVRSESSAGIGLA